MNTNGVVIWEGPSPVDGSPIVLIATGLRTRSANRKTGDMIQTWILRSDLAPVDALATGDDESICGGCVHRGTFDDTGKRVGRSCYVNVGQAPRGIWATYRIGRYPRMTPDEARAAFAGRAVRLGAYGDPGMVPGDVLRTIIADADTWTGYTHQWRWIEPGYADMLMASVESDAEREQARGLGYRCFMVVPAEHDDVPERAMLCAAERERNPLQCADCGACAGTRLGATTGAVDVFIAAHGTGKKYVSLQSANN